MATAGGALMALGAVYPVQLVVGIQVSSAANPPSFWNPLSVAGLVVTGVGVVVLVAGLVGIGSGGDGSAPTDSVGRGAKSAGDSATLALRQAAAALRQELLDTQCRIEGWLEAGEFSDTPHENLRCNEWFNPQLNYQAKVNELPTADHDPVFDAYRAIKFANDWMSTRLEGEWIDFNAVVPAPLALTDEDRSRIEKLHLAIKPGIVKLSAIVNRPTNASEISMPDLSGPSRWKPPRPE